MRIGNTGMRATLVAFFATLAFGSARAADMQQLVQELQRTSSADGQIQMVWWMAQQFWEESVKENPSITDDVRRQLLEPLSGYTIIAVMRARIGGTGLTDAASKAELQQNLHLQFEGKELKALPPEEISPAAQMLLAQTKPALAATAGPVGENIEFIVFPRTVDGKTLDASKPGTLTASLYGNTQEWHLPLASLQAPKVDKKTGEQFPGNYEYNPYTGKKLDAK